MTSEAIAATVHRRWAADLEPRTLYDILRLRVEVFVVEQACPYSELDGRDLEDGARHYWLGGSGQPEPVLGCVRLLREPGGADFRIGRLCTAKSARGRGLGRRLMEAALAEVGDDGCVLDSQEHLADFYVGYGFRPTGPAYNWDGVAHVPMRRDGR
ncbi:GNAT family N-acetyltransferase [Pseudonocardia sp. CA-142604]|uniref:GNAT family N-acetyltransferase n=1 Tax=Pseudonocardia sp. CA-142604 TaxID=3240024 RepID=UPI003D92AEA9